MTKRRMHPMCVTCLIKKQQEAISGLADVQRQLEYMQFVARTVSDNCLTDSPSLILYKIMREAQRYFPGADTDLFAAEKQRFNGMLLPRQEDIYKRITESPEPLLTALLVSMTGNYIDSGTVSDINEQTLNSIMFDFDRLGCDISAYRKVKKRISEAHRLTVLHDNCGEVVLDKLLIRLLKRDYPDKEIIAVVRGGPVINDVTLTEARQVGLEEYSLVVESGAAIAGTELEYLSPQASDAVLGADFIISKGQGNFETLCGCGLPIVYLFLCKCPLQCYRFGCKPLTGVMKLEDGVSLFDTIE